MLDEYLLVGEVVRPQGVKGEVKVKPYTDDLGRFNRLKTIYIKDEQDYVQKAMRCVRVHDGMVYLRIDNAATMEEAEKQRGAMLYVDRKHAVSLGDEENFICDLIGCVARDGQGKEIGVLKDVLTNTPTDVYVFETNKGIMMMPALKRVVLSVDVLNKIMMLDGDALQEVAVFED